jgi:hypothetical protein
VTDFTLDAPLYFHTVESAIVLPQSSQKAAALGNLSGNLCRMWFAGLCRRSLCHSDVARSQQLRCVVVVLCNSRFDEPRLARCVAARMLFAFPVILIRTDALLPYLRRPHLLHGVAGSFSNLYSELWIKEAKSGSLGLTTLSWPEFVLAIQALLLASPAPELASGALRQVLGISVFRRDIGSRDGFALIATRESSARRRR